MNKLLSTHYKHFLCCSIKLSEQFKHQSINTALKFYENYAALCTTIIICTVWSAFFQF